VWQTANDPFGEATEVVSAVEQNLRFPGQYYDQEIEQHYNYYRNYDPRLGRYIQSDPIGVLRDYSDSNFQVAIEVGVLIKSGTAGEELNHLYGYVGQNPFSWIDPYGLASTGNYKLDEDQLRAIRERLKDPNLSKKERNELKQKLKRHEKATGERGTRPD